MPDAVTGACAKTKAEAAQLCMEAARNGQDVVVHPSGISGPYDEGKNHVVQLIMQYMDGESVGGVRAAAEMTGQDKRKDPLSGVFPFSAGPALLRSFSSFLSL